MVQIGICLEYGKKEYIRVICSALYEMCKILVWQNFMFGRVMYPSHDEFHRSVEQKDVYNTHRLRSHPSLTLWIGNHEI